MKYTFYAIVTVCTLALCCSCSSWKDVSSVRSVEPEAYGNIVRPLVFEIDNVSTEKITDTIRLSQDKYTYKDTELMIRDAKSQVVLKHKIDVLVDPTYRITRKSDYSDFIVIISGFPGHYKKIRPAEPEDKWMFDFYEHKSNSADGSNK